MNVELIETIMSLPPTEETLQDLFGIIIAAEDRKSVDKYVRWVREEAMKIPTLEMYMLVRRTYLFAGQYDFDSFMIAMEFDRDPKARFWLPRRNVLEGKHKLASQIQEFIDDPKALYLGLSTPPGCGKSTLIKFMLAYMIGRDPNSQSMYVSYGDGMVKLIFDAEISFLTDDFEYNFNEIFPGIGKPDVSSEYKTISYRRKGDFPSLGLISLGGSITGRTRANAFLVVDDLVKNKEQARSPERLATLFEDFQATLTTRTIGETTRTIMIGTIWSIHDPISRMKEIHRDDPRYKFIAIPVEDENGHSNFLYDCPDRYTDERIAEIKATLDPVDYSCLYLQQGMEKFGLAFPSNELRYYNGVLPDGEPDNIAFVTDIAWGGGDSLAMPIAYIYGDDVYIHDVVFDRGDKFHTKPRVLGKILQHQCKKGRMEANNGGDEYCDDIGKMLKEHGYSMLLTHKKAPTNMGKMARIEQHSPNIKTFYYRDRSCRSKEYDDFMSELCNFSYTTKNLHDDAPDSMAMLVDFLYGGVKMVRTAKRPF